VDDLPGDPEEVTRFGRGRVELEAGEKEGVFANLKFMKLNLVLSKAIGTEERIAAKRKSHNGCALGFDKPMMVSLGLLATRGSFPGFCEQRAMGNT
jgi:hypothetical protein